MLGETKDNPCPQLENGFIQIATEIFDALCAFRIPGEERQCLDFILRKTYGYHKKEDAISNSQFVAATGLKKGNVSRAIKNLVLKKLVIKSDNNVVSTYRFNKNYKTWKQLSKKITVIKNATPVIKSDNKQLSKTMDTKDIKDTIQKKEGKKFSPPSIEELKAYFSEKGYSQESAQKAFEYYSAGNWHDSKGSPVKNWKQKMISVWFKPENKINQNKEHKPHYINAAEMDKKIYG